MDDLFVEDRVIGSEVDCDGPPTTDEGEVLAVETERVDERPRTVTQKACQVCETPVELHEPHIWVFVRSEWPHGPQFKRPVFCSESCWTAWSSQ